MPITPLDSDNALNSAMAGSIDFERELIELFNPGSLQDRVLKMISTGVLNREHLLDSADPSYLSEHLSCSIEDAKEAVGRIKLAGLLPNTLLQSTEFSLQEAFQNLYHLVEEVREEEDFRIATVSHALSL